MMMFQRRQNQRRASRRLRGGWLTATTGVALAAAVVAAGGGVWWWLQQRGTPDASGLLLHTVHRDNFELTVMERGEIESYDVTEVRSAVKANNTPGYAILQIVPEGTEVEEGDFLVQLDASALEAERLAQQILVNGAKAAEVEAQNLYETAVIDKREYIDGTYLEERQLIESEVFVAEENLSRAEEYYKYSQRLANRGYVNENQLEADRFAVEKAKKDLQTANTKLRVLDEYTRPKMIATLESAILIAQAKWESAQNSYQLERDKLADIEDQIAKCRITAPRAGTVRYAHQSDRGRDEVIIEEGTVIREGQVIIRLPKADSRQVELTINESLVEYVRPGMPALISPVGTDRVLRGHVRHVNQYAEPTGWRRANVKEYKAFVAIDDPAPGIRSGLTASVTIQCDRVPDALLVPVQSVYVHGDRSYAFVYDAGHWSAQEIKPGPTNDKFFVVEAGLDEGDRVALNPRQQLAHVSLPRLAPEVAQRAVPLGIRDPQEQVAQDVAQQADEQDAPPDDAPTEAEPVARSATAGVAE